MDTKPKPFITRMPMCDRVARQLEQALYARPNLPPVNYWPVSAAVFNAMLDEFEQNTGSRPSQIVLGRVPVRVFELTELFDPSTETWH